jgi:sugar phosphate isomerase/epimerase
MRFRHPDGTVLHLAYCSNVHPAEDVDGIVAQLRRFAGPVRQRIGVDKLGIGLWLPVTAVEELTSGAATLRTLVEVLAAEKLEVFTVNGFPYRGFQSPSVKYRVYRPDWAESERLDYTLRLAWVLSHLLPDDVAEGSISPLPLMWRDRKDEATWAVAQGALDDAAEGLAKLTAETGRPIRLAVEPEPGCAIESTSQAIAALAQVDHEWIGACLDACHLAVQFEDPVVAVRSVAEADLPIVKSQLSCALRAPVPSAAPWLADYVEPRFLHQTRERTPAGEVLGVDDLDTALNGGLPGHGEWRVHYHVPVHSDRHTTQAELVATLRTLVGQETPVTTHLEVETYTWSVLPPDLRPNDDAGLVEGLAKELTWVASQLTDLGLETL